MEENIDENIKEELDDASASDAPSADTAEEVKSETPDVKTINIDELQNAQGDTPSSTASGDVAKLQAEVESERSQRLRAFADLENFRKRKEQELVTFKKYASEKVILELLPIVDSLALALSHSENTESEDQNLLEGVQLIQKQFQSVFDKLGVKQIEALGQKFDPHFHQAVLQEDSDQEADIVIREMQSGYLLHDRVIRPSMVVVSK